MRIKCPECGCASFEVEEVSNGVVLTCTSCMNREVIATTHRKSEKSPKREDREDYGPYGFGPGFPDAYG